ncbi:MAG: hypothetical protein AAFP04_04960 [Myxococcota bacterium]
MDELATEIVERVARATADERYDREELHAFFADDPSAFAETYQEYLKDEELAMFGLVRFETN